MADQAKPKNIVKRSLHLLHASGRFDLSNAEQEHDLRFALSKDPDVYSTTEVDDPKQLEMMRRVGKDMGYSLHRQVRVAEPFMVKKQDNLTVKNMGKVIAAQGSGSIPTRYVSWLHLSFYGLDVYTHVCHWLAHTENDKVRTNAYLKQMNAMCAQVRKHGRGSSMSFFQGDLNYDEDDRDRLHGKNSPVVIFREQNMKIVYDELHVTPAPTHGGRAIDVIGRYMNDDRPKATRYKVYPKQNSDHRALSAWYDIEVRKKTPNPDKPDDPSDKPFKVTGDIDWSDYDDDTQYPLPSAVDDSDTFNG